MSRGTPFYPFLNTNQQLQLSTNFDQVGYGRKSFFNLKWDLQLSVLMVAVRPTHKSPATLYLYIVWNDKTNYTSNFVI